MANKGVSFPKGLDEKRRGAGLVGGGLHPRDPEVVGGGVRCTYTHVRLAERGTLGSAGGGRRPEEMRPEATGHLTDFRYVGGYQRVVGRWT